ncbi:CsbD family protein [Streptomyces sp. NPDC055134]
MAGKGGTDKVKVKAKETTGKVTGERGKAAGGRAGQAKGEESLREGHDRARGAAEPLKRSHS